MVENVNSQRGHFIDEYRIIFDEFPSLRALALSYWERTKKLPSDPIEAKAEEKKIFDETVLAISNILLDEPTFLEAMKITGKDPSENAIIESFQMIDIVLDIDTLGSDEIKL